MTVIAETLQTQQTKMQSELKEIRIDDFKEQITQMQNNFNLYAKKEDIDENLVEMMQGITSNSNNVKNLLTDFTQYKTRIEIRLDTMQDQLRKASDDLKRISGANKNDDRTGSDSVVYHGQLTGLRRKVDDLQNDVHQLK